jgi:hypothetical protein
MKTRIEQAEKKAARAASAARIAAAQAEMRAHVARGTCPHCGARLRLNTSMTGWWQCGRYGSDNFRAPEYRGLPGCSFQGFTE